MDVTRGGATHPAGFQRCSKTRSHCINRYGLAKAIKWNAIRLTKWSITYDRWIIKKEDTTETCLWQALQHLFEVQNMHYCQGESQQSR